MPELPEVETTCRGIAPHIEQQIFKKIIIRQPKLRYPIPSDLIMTLPGQSVHSVTRRSKYLLIHTDAGHLIIHLGMSGRLHALTNPPNAAKHDHVDILFKNDVCLRYHDPRRFGMILWTAEEPQQHKLLRSLGPEPLSNEFNGNYLYQQSRGRSRPIKQFIMDGHVVVGVGNIYASESLFQAGIAPKRAAQKISKHRYERLADEIKQVLSDAITAGGTTLKDFSAADGKPGYFQQQLNVYGRNGQTCPNCQSSIKKIILGQRSTFYCPSCQH